MTINQIVQLLQNGVWQVFRLTAPVLGAALVVGLVVAIFQATTSIQEQTLTFLPKMLIILLAIALLGSWMFSSMAQYTRDIFSMISRM